MSPCGTSQAKLFCQGEILMHTNSAYSSVVAGWEGGGPPLR
jgi:hypothetical protein